MLADRLRIPRRNPYVPAAQVAVTFWDIGALAAPVSAFRVYDPDTMLEVAGPPVIAKYSPFGAFSPGGTYYAVILNEASLAATLKIYNVSDWTEAYSGAIPSAANDTGHISWSASGRFVCAFVGPRYLFLDANNSWASSTIVDLPASGNDNYEHTSAFLGDRGLVVSGGFDAYVSLHEITEAGPPVTVAHLVTYTTIESQAIVDARMVSAVRPTAGQVLADLYYAIYLERSGGDERIWVMPWNSATRAADVAVSSAASSLLPNLFYQPDNSELAISDPDGLTMRIRRFDVAASYAELTAISLGTTASLPLAGYSETRDSFFVADSQAGPVFVLREYDGTALTLTGTHELAEESGQPSSVSVSDWTVNSVIPPA